MSLLHYVVHNNVDEVKRLLAQRINVNVINQNNESALYIACENGFSDIARLLLNHGALVNCLPIPLIAAARNGHETCVRLLLEFKANVHSTDSKGISAMRVACDNRHYSVVELLWDRGAGLTDVVNFISLLEPQEMSLARSLIEKIMQRQRHKKCPDRMFFHCLRCAFKTGLKELALIFMSEARPNANQHYSFALYYSVKYNWLDIVNHILDRGIDINCASDSHESQTTLYCACEQGHKDIAHLLLQRGADVNACNQVNCSKFLYPIQIAAARGNVEITQLLLEHGAALHDQKSSKTTGSPTSRTPPLHLAFDGDHMEIVELLLQKGSFIDVNDINGETILLKAARTRRVESVRKLLKLGASASCVNKSNETILHVVLSNIVKRNDGSFVHEAIENDECIDIQNRQQYAERHSILNQCEYSSCSTAVKASDRSELEVAAVIEVLLQNGADYNAVCSEGETALYRACKLKLGRVAKLLIGVGSAINVTSFDKHPFLAACENGSAEIVQQLLVAGADVNLVPTGLYSGFRAMHGSRVTVSVSTTPLCTAVKNCRTEVVKVLLEHGADANVCDYLGKTAFDYIIDHLVKTHDKHQEYIVLLRMLVESKEDILSNNLTLGKDNPLYRACAESLHDVVEVLLQYGVSHTQLSDVAMSSALAVACRNNDDSIVELLLSHGIEASRAEAGQFPGISVTGANLAMLSIPAVKGNVKMVGMLIKAGFNVNQTDGSGNTALHAASCAAIADILIKNGADVNILNRMDESPLYSACIRRRLDVAAVLLENFACVNGSTTAIPLVVACRANCEELVEMLLQHGADPDTSFVHKRSLGKFTSASHVNALFFACENYNKTIVKALLAANAKTNVVDVKGNSALHVALSALARTNMATGVMNMEIVDLLLSRLDSTTVNICNEKGKTPLCVAVKKGLHEVVVKLVNFGADVNACSSDNHPLIIACQVISPAKQPNSQHFSLKNQIKRVAADGNSKPNMTIGAVNLSTIELLLFEQSNSQFCNARW
jgi:ankyrin repeat protein